MAEFMIGTRVSTFSHFERFVSFLVYRMLVLAYSVLSVTPAHGMSLSRPYYGRQKAQRYYGPAKRRGNRVQWILEYASGALERGGNKNYQH